jgi:hypothetical protein
MIMPAGNATDPSPEEKKSRISGKEATCLAMEAAKYPPVRISAAETPSSNMRGLLLF